MKKPVRTLLIASFSVSWVIWILAALVAGSDRAVLAGISAIGAFGPAIAAIFVSAANDPIPSNASARKRWTVFAIVSIVAFILQLFLVGDFRYQVVLPITLVSLVAAYVVSSVYHPKRGVTRLMQGLNQISAKNVWLWTALLLPFAWQVIAAVIHFGLGGAGLSNLTLNSLALQAATYLTVLLVGGPINEEPGWRGFAVPQLQQRYSPLITGLLVGLIWTVWHLPLHLADYYPGGVDTFLLRFPSNVPLGVTFTWLYNRSKGNLFACILLHASINTAPGILGAPFLLDNLVMIAFTTIVVLHDKMFKKHSSQAREKLSMTTIPVV
jgi:membrane protease YdiL (CAAX protease family)